MKNTLILSMFCLLFIANTDAQNFLSLSADANEGIAMWNEAKYGHDLDSNITGQFKYAEYILGPKSALVQSTNVAHCEGISMGFTKFISTLNQFGFTLKDVKINFEPLDLNYDKNQVDWMFNGRIESRHYSNTKYYAYTISLNNIPLVNKTWTGIDMIIDWGGTPKMLDDKISFKSLAYIPEKVANGGDKYDSIAQAFLDEIGNWGMVLNFTDVRRGTEIVGTGYAGHELNIITARIEKGSKYQCIIPTYLPHFTITPNDCKTFTFAEGYQPQKGIFFSKHPNLKTKWFLGDGTNLNDSVEFTHSYTKFGKMNVGFKIFDINDTTCTITKMDSLFVSNLSSVSFTNTPVNNRIQFNANNPVGGSGKFSYEWNFGDGSSSVIGPKSTEHVFDSIKSYIVNLKTTEFDNSACSINATLPISITKVDSCKIAASFTVDPIIKQNQDFYLSGQIDNKGNPFNTMWIMGNNDTIFNNTSPMYNYNNPGTYTVKLIATDKANMACFKTAQMNITVNTGPVVNIKYISSPNLNYTFEPFVTGTPKFYVSNWEINGEFFYNPKIAYIFKSDTINYSICVNIVDEETSSNIKKCIVLKPINCNLILSQTIVNPTDATATNGSIIIDSVINGKTPITYQWEGFGNTNVKTNLKAGTYSVTITDNNKCEFVGNFPLIAKTLSCEAAFIANSKAQEPNTLIFTNTSTGLNLQSKWDFTNGESSGEFSPTHKFPYEGSFNVCLQISDTNAHCQSQTCQRVYAGSKPACYVEFFHFKDSAALQLGFTGSISAGVDKINWLFGDNTSSQEKNPIHTYKEAGSYHICLIGEDVDTKCVHQNCEDIYVNTQSACDNDFFVVSDSTGAGAQFNLRNKTDFLVNWSFGDGTYSKQSSVYHKFLAAGKFNVCLDITEPANKCKNHLCKDIFIGKQKECSADFFANIDTVSKKIEFKNLSSANTAYNYWVFDDGSTSNEESPIVTFTKDRLYNICLSTTDSTKQCFDHVCKPINIGTTNFCQANFNILIDSGSANTKFTDNSGISNAAYFWDFGDGAFDKLQNPNHTFLKNGRYSACLTVNDITTKCINRACKDVIIGQQPMTADFNYFVDPTTKKVILTDQSSGSILKWYWTLGDGGYSSNQNDAYTFVKDGNYNICLYIKNATENASICKSVTINTNPCQANFTAYTDITTKETKYSNSSSPGITNWFWELGDGTTSSQSNPVHIYKLDDRYRIVLSVFDSVAKCKAMQEQIIYTGSKPCKAAFTIAADPATNTVTFINSSQGTGISYFWSFGENKFSNEESPVIKYDKAGKFGVNLTIKTASCFDQIMQDVQIGTISCDAAFSHFSDSSSNQISFINEAIGNNIKYYWNFGDGSYSNATDPIHKYYAPGFYRVSLSTNDPISGCMSKFDKVIQIGSMGIDCKAEYTYQADMTTNIVSLFSTSTTKETGKLVWDFGDGTREFTTSTSTDHTYKNPGYFNVCLTINDTINHCKNTSCNVIKAGENTNYCHADFMYTVSDDNKSVTFADNSQGNPVEWHWDFGDSTYSKLQNPLHSYADTGYYKVHLRIGNAKTNCFNDFLSIINVGSQQNKLKAIFGYLIDTSFVKGVLPVEFKGSSYGESSEVDWDFGDGSSNSSSMSPTHEYSEAGDYNVCLTVSDQTINQTDTYCQNVSVTNGVTGIEKTKTATEQVFAIYPNPAKNELMIQVSTHTYNKENIITSSSEAYRDAKELIITNSLGQIVFSTTLKQNNINTYKLDLTNISNGMYILRLNGEVKKFIVNK